MKTSERLAVLDKLNRLKDRCHLMGGGVSVDLSGEFESYVASYKLTELADEINNLWEPFVLDLLDGKAAL